MRVMNNKQKLYVCDTCAYCNVSIDAYPCNNCSIDDSKYEPIEKEGLVNDIGRSNRSGGNGMISKLHKLFSDWMKEKKWMKDIGDPIYVYEIYEFLDYVERKEDGDTE